jgi:hypothetical protein
MTTQDTHTTESALAHAEVSNTTEVSDTHHPTPIAEDYTTEVVTDLRELGADVRGGVRVVVGWSHTYRGDVPVSVSISLLSTDTQGTLSPTKELTGKLIRSLNIGTLFRRARRTSHTPHDIEQVAIPRHNGSRTTTEMLTYVANLYREAYSLGEPIHEYIAKRTGRPRSTVEKMIMRARKQGILGSAISGRAGEKE